MNDLSATYIREYLKHHQLSDYDSESDSSSSGMSELDDEYHQIIEKPIPIEELKRNTVNSFPFLQRGSSQTYASTVSCNNYQTINIENFTSDIYSECLQRQFAYDDEPLTNINNDTVISDSFCYVTKKKSRQKKVRDSQETSNVYGTNFYNCLLGTEENENHSMLEHGVNLRSDPDFKTKKEEEGKQQKIQNTSINRKKKKKKKSTNRANKTTHKNEDNLNRTFEIGTGSKQKIPLPVSFANYSAVPYETFSSTNLHVEYDRQREFGCANEPITKINNDIAESELFCEVRKRKSRQKNINHSQETDDIYRTNFYSCLDTEGIETEDKNQSFFEEDRINIKRIPDFKLKRDERKVKQKVQVKQKKKKNSTNKVNTAIVKNKNIKGIDKTRIGNLQKATGQRMTQPTKDDLNPTEKNIAHWRDRDKTALQQAFLKPIKQNRDDTSLSWITNKKALLKKIQPVNKTATTQNPSLVWIDKPKKVLLQSIQSSTVQEAKPSYTKNQNQDKYYNDNNVWRVSNSLIHKISVIVGILNQHKTPPKKSKTKQRKNLYLPFKQQTGVFPNFHHIPKTIFYENHESIAENYKELFVHSIASLIEDVLRDYPQSPYSNFMPDLKPALAGVAIQEGLKSFGLSIKKRLVGITLTFGIDNYGVRLKVKTRDNLKYSKSIFRVICK